jgi:glycine/D-amino acid oxidase-like deaminating enzyme
MAKKALIFGAGLAGTCLAHRLLSSGIEVKIVDQGSNYSSAVAAGMVNPMVFRRMNKSWRLDEFLPEAQTFYQEIGRELQTQFYHPIVIRRFFSSDEERESWQRRSEEEAYESYLEKLTASDLAHTAALNTFGSGRVKNAFWVDAAKWVAQHTAYFNQKGILLQKEFAAQLWEPQLRKYDGETYDFVIFCMGYRQNEEQTFSYLPLQQTKGQTLLIESAQLGETESLNRKCFVLPYGEGRFRVGATYEFNNTTLHVTEEGREQLLQNLALLGAYEPVVVEQSAGIRPTVLDRRPLMGQHPIHQGVYVFNGLGTKGYMMAPTLARELVAHLLENKPLHSETNMSRFTDRTL